MPSEPKKATRETTKLTDTEVKKLAPGEGLYTVWDGGHQVCVQGLGVRVMPSGSKSFVWKYCFNGKQRWMTIGKTSVWSVTAARDHIKALAQDIDKGIDPASKIAEDKANPTMKDLAKKFLEEHVSAKRKASTYDDYENIIQKYILKPLGKIQVKDITAAHISKVHSSLKDKPYRANRTLAVLSSMLSLAETWGYRKPNTNPCGSIERYQEEAKTRFLTAGEIARLLIVLQAQEGRYPLQVRLIRLLLLTGARLREILNCRWSAKKGEPTHPYLDREGARIVCIDHKGSRRGGPKDIILSTAALEVIDTLDKRLGSPYLFPSPDNHMVPLANPHHAWLTIKEDKKRGEKERLGIRDLAGIPDVRLHDLRHSFGTLSVTLNQNPTVRQKLLGHASAVTTERYSHVDVDPLREAVEQIGETIKGLKKA